MDIDETNLTLSVANIQNTFETEQAIPEKDSYRYSKLHAELTTYSGRISTDVITAANFLEAFDEEMARMDEAGVPEEGRMLYVTPTMNKIVKEAEGLQRVMTVASPSTINRKVHSLDDVTIKMVPAARMKTKYDFTTGCVASADAKQINWILIHTSCVVCRDKYSYIKLFTPGTDSRTADGYLYQNRCYGDLFLLEKKVEGCARNVEAAGAEGGSMRAVKGNKEYTIDESQQKSYQDAGFDIVGDDGRVTAYGRGKTVPFDEYMKAVKEIEHLQNIAAERYTENEALKAEIAALQAPKQESAKKAESKKAGE